MKYKAFYRTYRPTIFDEVKGQENIIKTLTNTISMNKISHAYLFCGPRGTGKTSVAKIFANVINCSHSIDKTKACEICLKNINNSMDVIEIDAASNNGVNEIRELREKIKYLPTQSKYKIYIIDEVHMLTKGAFNALLKTLEEPPAHAIFIFATTDPDKLPLTILSRVQRYNFSRISKKVLMKQIKVILDRENILYEENVLSLVADLANGSLRDALSIIDQANAYSNSNIKTSDINQIFGLVSNQKQIDILNALVVKNINQSINLLNDLIDRGIDIKRFIISLISLIKNYILYKKTLSNEIIDFENIDLLNEINLNSDKAYFILEILIDLLKNIKYSENPKELVELAFIKICSLDETLKEFDYHQVENNFINKSKIDKIPTKEIKKSETKVITDDFELMTSHKKNDNFKNETLEEDFEDDEDLYFNNEEKQEKEFLDLENKEVSVEEDKEKDDVVIKNKISTDEFLNRATSILNISNEEEGMNQDLNEDLLNDEKTNNDEVLYDTNEISLEEMIQEEEIKKTNSFNVSKEHSYTNEIKTKSPSITKEITKVLTQPEIINLFLLANQNEMKITKDQFQKSKIFKDIIFEDFIDLLDGLNVIAASHDFILFASEKTYLVNEINDLKNSLNFKKYIIKAFGVNKHIFIINKRTFLDSKDLWQELKAANKMPLPVQLPPLENIDSEENSKNDLFLKKGNELFGKIFKKKMK
ncbi:MAG: DNA polymerase III subunit gamma/tau [Metamycoplasmataceae bacterium]